MEITKKIVNVMQLVNENIVYRVTPEKGQSSLAYKNNIEVIRQLEIEGLIGCFGNCRRDYFLTQQGLDIYTKNKGRFSDD